jgi:hypothetical protein
MKARKISFPVVALMLAFGRPSAIRTNYLHLHATGSTGKYLA